jgi:replication factor A1
MDHAGQMWITAFNEVAEQMMGISANELSKLKDNGPDVEYSKYFQNLTGKTYTFQMMAKADSYNVCRLEEGRAILTNQGEARVRYQCRKAALPDYVAESAHLKQLIDAMNI